MNRRRRTFVPYGIAMRLVYSAVLLAALGACASGRQLVAEGRLPDGGAYRDYSTQPFGFLIERETYGPEGKVREVRNLLTEDNFKNLRNGMTPQEVAAVVGPSPLSERRSYAGGTHSWSYRYKDIGVIKLLHVIFGADQRVQAFYTEWDPNVYSKDGRDRGDSHK
jgi:hypothetical protein